MACCSKAMFNVLLLGLSFMLVFTAFQTWGNVQKVVIESISKDYPDFHGDAFYSLAIIYAVFSICNWAAPSVISVIGPRLSMLVGGVTYLLFILSFAIPKTWLLYVVSAVIGVGAALIWTGQGNYLSLNSTKSTISRNSGLFWAMLQCSMFIGNLFVFFAFKNKNEVDSKARQIVVWTLSGVCLSGIVAMVFFQKPPERDDSDDEVDIQTPSGPLEALRGAGRLFCTKNMLLLNLTFFYSGLELGFFSGVYGACLGFTKSFTSNKELVGLSGIFIGVGEVLGGALFGILGTKTMKWGRDPIVILGFIVHIVAFFLIFLNLPNDSPFTETDSTAFITSNKELAIFCSFMLGFGDACYNTQIFSLLGGVYAKDSASAFAIFKFSQSVAAAASFFYAPHLVLYGQLGILIVFAIVGTCSFVWVEWAAKKIARKEKEESDRK